MFDTTKRMSEAQVANLLVRKLMPKFMDRLHFAGPGHDTHERFDLTVEAGGQEMKAVVTVELLTPRADGKPARSRVDA